MPGWLDYADFLRESPCFYDANAPGDCQAGFALSGVTTRPSMMARMEDHLQRDNNGFHGNRLKRLLLLGNDYAVPINASCCFRDCSRVALLGHPGLAAELCVSREIWRFQQPAAA